MKVSVDQMWTSPSGLGFRIIIFGDNGEWRQKRYSVLPWNQIPEEVMTEIIGMYLDREPEEDYHQTALF